MAVMVCAFASCANKSTPPVQQEESIAAVPEFNADSAYMYIENQVAFGPRVPNSPAHKACGDYLISELKRFGAEVYVQETTLTAYNGDRLQARNIIASYDISNPRRVLLFAHWDSRPYADNDADPDTRRTPIDGADDGASGVGVLLEIARQLNAQTPAGIDIIFFDAEDYGPPSFENRSYTPDTWWCLGSQFWARNPHTPNYRAAYGILLDMVGAKDATFYKEETSVKRASSIIDKVWGEARNLGFGKYFLNAKGGYITDDHQYVIAGRNIPCIDIINYNNDNIRGFGDYWHTHDDTLDNISRETLKAVGQTVMGVICKPLN
ncbi:MAG: M28 family peptidase [Tannerellaceae bacterium]|nr:M28 family peptidase [Tannerellaceae bacterium]